MRVSLLAVLAVTFVVMHSVRHVWGSSRVAPVVRYDVPVILGPYLKSIVYGGLDGMALFRFFARVSEKRAYVEENRYRHHICNRKRC